MDCPCLSHLDKFINRIPCVGFASQAIWLCDSRYGTAAFCGFILSLIVHHKHNPSCVGLMVSHPRGLRNIFSFRFFSLFTSKPKMWGHCSTLKNRWNSNASHNPTNCIHFHRWNRSTKLQEMPSIHLDSNHCLRCQPERVSGATDFPSLVGFDSSHSTNLTAKFDMCQLEYYPMSPFQEGKLPCVPSSNSNIHVNCRLEPVFRGQKCSFSIFSQLGQKLFKVIESYGSGNSMFNSEVSH